MCETPAGIEGCNEWGIEQGSEGDVEQAAMSCRMSRNHIFLAPARVTVTHAEHPNRPVWRPHRPAARRRFAVRAALLPAYNVLRSVYARIAARVDSGMCADRPLRLRGCCARRSSKLCAALNLRRKESTARFLSPDRRELPPTQRTAPHTTNAVQHMRKSKTYSRTSTSSRQRRLPTRPRYKL